MSPATPRHTAPVLTEPACLYDARVMHRRRVPPFYRFIYRVFYLLIDIDRIDEAAQGLRWFSHNRFNLLAFHDADHGDGTRFGLRRWAEQLLATGGIELAGGRIRLLCLPRLAGFAFNPISLWYCEDANRRVRAVIVEVNNTFGEKHCYLLVNDKPASDGAAPSYEMEHHKDKCFHVSPFFDLVGRYRFRLTAPGERVRVAIHETREGSPLLDATLAGERRDLRDGTILKLALAMPLMTLKVVAGIHWEALKIWLRGGRFHRKPPPPQWGVT